MNLAILGKRIRGYREKRNLKQIDVANALQVSAQAVSKWERGENAPDISLWLGLSKLLGISCDTLLGRGEEEDSFEGTVFCTALNQFAHRSRTMSPRDVASWANSIFYPVTEAALRFDGVPVKYVGDGFLGVFSGPGHAERALQAALEAKAITGRPELVIALHSGEVYLGDIGHTEYARLDIIGHAVNTAFLVMQWAGQHSKTGIALTKGALDAMDNAPKMRKAQKVRLELIEESVEVSEPAELDWRKAFPEKDGAGDEG
jgi:class 3 adenylate cyclase